MTEDQSPRSTARLPIVLTSRDYDVLLELFDSRLLTLSQIADIHFDSRREATKKRLQSLKQAKLIVARPRTSPSEPELLKLTRRGFEWLRESGQLSDYPRLTWASLNKRLKVSVLTQRHEIEVGNVKASIHRSARRDQIIVDRFITWPRLIRFRNPDARSPQKFVSPDGFFQLRVDRHDGSMSFAFFVEVDRGTETISRIVARAASYVEHYKSGAYAKRQGGDARQPQLHPFRVLWTFPSRARLMNFAKACREAHPPILKMMWLATIDEVIVDPLGAIWMRSGDASDIRHSLIHQNEKDRPENRTVENREHC